MVSPAQERNDLITELNEAAAVLARDIDRRLVPPSGGNIGYAVRGARIGNDVAAVPGGFSLDGNSVRFGGPACFGADGKMSRIILTAMKFDPAIRSAAVIRFLPDAFRVLSAMLMDTAETDSEKHPDAISTMDWAVASCCSDGVPEAIAIRAKDPERQVICIFGEDPGGIASNIIILSNRIQ